MYSNVVVKAALTALAGTALVSGAYSQTNADDAWLSAAPPHRLETDLGGKMIPWGHSGTHIGDETVNPIDKMEFVWIPAGSFTLGTNDPEFDYLSGARPAKSITLSGFWIGKYPVTWGQYTLYCEKQSAPLPQNPGFPKTRLHPVVKVTWDQAMSYARWAGGTLPTEYQWEHAARGPMNTKYPWGNFWDPLRCANDTSNQRTGTSPVGSFPNGRSGYGCFDMAGNVSQWCSDWASSSYEGKSGPDPQGAPSGTRKAVRGGGWGGLTPEIFLSSYRYRIEPNVPLDMVGFRVVVPG